jgi:hypothetical protein
MSDGTGPASFGFALPLKRDSHPVSAAVSSRSTVARRPGAGRGRLEVRAWEVDGALASLVLLAGFEDVVVD